MKTSKDLLGSILKTTQMGQIGIRSALETELGSDMRSAMESQLREYDQIEQEALSIARTKNWSLPEVNPSIRFMTDRMTRMKLSYGRVDSKVAAMMIKGNTSGIIKGLKNVHQLTDRDESICTLSNKLMETENANIQQMKSFL